jgi:hypothetical protein
MPHLVYTKTLWNGVLARVKRKIGGALERIEIGSGAAQDLRCRDCTGEGPEWLVERR